jgi:hypothetical protein
VSAGEGERVDRPELLTDPPQVTFERFTAEATRLDVSAEGLSDNALHLERSL